MGVDVKNVRITVMRKASYMDLIAKYEHPIEHACDIEEGQVLIANGWQKPGGLSFLTTLSFVNQITASGLASSWMCQRKT